MGGKARGKHFPQQRGAPMSKRNGAPKHMSELLYWYVGKENVYGMLITNPNWQRVVEREKRLISVR